MQDDTTTSIVAVFARVFWIMAGPMILLVMAVMIATKNSGWASGVSAGYLGVLAATIFARWLEFRRGAPVTSDEQPVTARDVRRYVAVATVAGLAVWIVANLLGNYVL